VVGVDLAEEIFCPTTMTMPVLDAFVPPIEFEQDYRDSTPVASALEVA
jgi:hypothetical protein